MNMPISLSEAHEFIAFLTKLFFLVIKVDKHLVKLKNKERPFGRIFLNPIAYFSALVTAFTSS